MAGWPGRIEKGVPGVPPAYTAGSVPAVPGMPAVDTPLPAWILSRRVGREDIFEGVYVGRPGPVRRLLQWLVMGYRWRRAKPHDPIW